MSRDFKLFMSGFMIATTLFMIGYIRLEHKHAIEITFVSMGGKIK